VFVAFEGSSNCWGQRFSKLESVFLEFPVGFSLCLPESFRNTPDYSVTSLGRENHMSLCELELRGVKLPEKETFLGDLTPSQIVEKIDLFHQRLQRESHLQVAPFAEAYFLNLIALYPVSMCSKTMTDTLKLVAALFYFGSKPPTEENRDAPQDELKAKELFPRNKPSPTHQGYSYEDLALIFDKTIPVIMKAVHQKREQAKVMLEEARLRCQSQNAAFEELTEEEKQTLSQRSKEQGTADTKEGDRQTTDAT
jgi:hypothetical protein